MDKLLEGKSDEACSEKERVKRAEKGGDKTGMLI